MTTNEFAEFILQSKKERLETEIQDEAAAYEVAQLISGSLIFPLYGVLWQGGFDMDTATQHLEALYDSGNHFGFVYFIFILANAAELIIPLQFTEMCANDALVHFLSAAIIDDWLECNAAGEVIESE